MSDGTYDLVVAGPAARGIGETLPEAVSAAVVEFITTAMIDNPQQVARPMRNELAGIHSASEVGDTVGTMTVCAVVVRK